METMLASLLVVALAEVGDKSLLLTLVLMARWRRAWPVFWGLVVGIGANFAFAVGLGY